MAIPVGIITIWASGSGTIPSGWQICDGTNGTPDLTACFVAGASSDAEVGVASGSASHVHTPPSFNSSTPGGHTVSGGTNNNSGTETGSGSTGSYGVVAGLHSHSYSATTSGHSSHSHTISTSGSAANLPSYYKLFYIMKI